MANYDKLGDATWDLDEFDNEYPEDIDCIYPPLDDEESGAYFDRYIAGDR